MEQFVVSARKYRPKQFDDVVGQEHITTTLKNAIKSSHLAHSFLFTGPRGIGKTTCARILAKTINCENISEDFEACDTCGSCKAFKESGSLNIFELDAASNNSVEDIRNLIEQVRYAPQQGKYKIYIIDEVHMLSQGAFNAFLKTLEEPPSYAIFILATTEKHKILPTILSRCQIFDFKRIQTTEIINHLKGICEKEAIQFEEEALHVIAQKADGALRDALSIFDRIVGFSNSNITYASVLEVLNVLDYTYYFKLTDFFLTEDVSAILNTFNEILNNGFEGDHFLLGLGEHLRNLLVSKDANTIALMEVSDSVKAKYLEQAKLVSTTFILNTLKAINDCDVNYKLAKDKRLHVELTLIKITYFNSWVETNQTGTASVEKKTIVSSPNTAPKTEDAKPVVTEATPIITEAAGGKVEPKIESSPELVSEVKIEPKAPVTNEPNVNLPIGKVVTEIPPKDPVIEEEKLATAEVQDASSAEMEKKPEPIVETLPVKEVATSSAQEEGIPKIEDTPSLSEPANTPLKSTPKLMSLDEINNEVVKEEQEEKVPEKEDEVEKREKLHIEEKDLLKAWQRYVIQIASTNKMSLLALMKETAPVIGEDAITVNVLNQRHVDLLNDEKIELTTFLKKELNLQSLAMLINIDESLVDDKPKVAYTPAEKFKTMAEKNPKLIDLKNKLDLNLEF